jgi:hypothetical protein
VKTFEHGELSLNVSRRAVPPTIDIVWAGRGSDPRVRPSLVFWFESVLDDAAADGARVEMRFEQLAHANSATITAILQMVQESRARKVPLAVVFDPTNRWQKMSFEAMRVVIADNPLIELRTA